jgi:hypothetical protein
MQAEILAANPSSKIRLLAVNDFGHETGNPLAVEGRVLPLLQDTAEAAVWTSWGIAYRDVVILDGENRSLGVFNLTDHNLSLKVEYDALLDFLRLKAGE